MDDLKALLGDWKKARPKPNVKLHSEAHLLADEISTAFGERKRFAMYLGVINRVGPGEARRIFRELQLEAKGNLGKLFMYLCSKKAREAKAKKVAAIKASAASPATKDESASQPNP
ncbi:MAG: hypothetical protein RLZZ324_306 [Candidatus Parcubacteria bacterium]|jgi:hypothetical protein